MLYEVITEAFRVHGRDLSPERLSELISDKSRAFHAILRGGVRPLPGAVPLIRSIRSRGIPLAISSGALRSDIDPILDHLGLTACRITSYNVCYTKLLRSRWECRVDRRENLVLTPGGVKG